MERACIVHAACIWQTLESAPGYLLFCDRANGSWLHGVRALGQQNGAVAICGHCKGPVSMLYRCVTTSTTVNSMSEGFMELYSSHGRIVAL
jgi:hypothetical protein